MLTTLDPVTISRNDEWDGFSDKTDQADKNR